MQLWTRVHRCAFSQSATTVLHYFCTWLDCHAITIYNNGRQMQLSVIVDLPSLLFFPCFCIKFYTEAHFLGPSYLLSVNTKMSYWYLNLNLLCPTTDWTYWLMTPRASWESLGRLCAFPLRLLDWTEVFCVQAHPGWGGSVARESGQSPEQQL